MTDSLRAPRPFAKLFDIDGEQVLFELLPSKDEDRRREGVPDAVISADLGWARYEARVGLSFTDKGRQECGDLHAYLLEDFTQERARRALAQARAQWGADAMAGRAGEQAMDPAEVVAMLQAPGRLFAKVLDVDGRQVVATTANDLGESEEDEGLVVKVGQAGDWVKTLVQPGASLDAFDTAAARMAVAEADLDARPSSPRLQ